MRTGDNDTMIEHIAVTTPWYNHSALVSVSAEDRGGGRWGFKWWSNCPGKGGMPIDAQRSSETFPTAATALAAGRADMWRDMRETKAME